jgi:hypothetical protein
VRQELLVRDISARAGVSEGAVWPRVRKTVARGTEGSRRILPPLTELSQGEKGLIWALIHRPADALGALKDLGEEDLEALTARPVLDLALKLEEDNGFSPAEFFQRLSSLESQLVTGVAAQPEDAVWALEYCLQQFRRIRLERERRALQRQIDRLQAHNAPEDAHQLAELLTRKYELIRQIDVLI